MKTEYFKYLSADGKTSIDAVKWMPDDGDYHAILQHSHGMLDYKERYEPFAEYLVGRGFMVVANDHLGHGESVNSPEDWGYIAESDPAHTLVEDMHTLRLLVRKDAKDVPYFMIGHSLGSFLLRWYLSEYGEGVSGAIIMGTATYPDIMTTSGMMVDRILALFKGWHAPSPFVQSLVFGNKYFKPYDLTGKDLSNSWLTKDEELVDKFYHDPKDIYPYKLNGFLAVFQSIHYVNQKEHISSIPKGTSVLFVSGEKDPVGYYGKGVKQAYQKFKKYGPQDVSMHLYKNDRHDLLMETNKYEIFEDLYQWLVKVERKEKE